MFGHDDDQQQPAQDNASTWPAPAPDPTPDATLDNTSVTPTTSPTVTPTEPSPQTDNNISPDEPATGSPELPTDQVTPSVPVDSTGTDGLTTIKQQALQQLSPLVSHLEQTPEEKFRTTMMMIQASDDQSLVQTAFEAAQAITDDKERAQALLDVINEINYFTQHTQQPQIN